MNAYLAYPPFSPIRMQRPHQGERTPKYVVQNKFNNIIIKTYTHRYTKRKTASSEAEHVGFAKHYIYSYNLENEYEWGGVGQRVHYRRQKPVRLSRKNIERRF